MSLLNYQFSQKLKLLENCKFNHLTIILTLSISCGPPKLSFNKWGPTRKTFNIFNKRYNKDSSRTQDHLL